LILSVVHFEPLQQRRGAEVERGSSGREHQPQRKIVVSLDDSFGRTLRISHDITSMTSEGYELLF